MPSLATSALAFWFTDPWSLIIICANCLTEGVEALVLATSPLLMSTLFAATTIAAMLASVRFGAGGVLALALSAGAGALGFSAVCWFFLPQPAASSRQIGITAVNRRAVHRSRGRIMESSRVRVFEGHGRAMRALGKGALARAQPFLTMLETGSLLPRFRKAAA